MRLMKETVTDDPALRPAPGEEHHLALALANSAIALPGGQFVDLLDTPATTHQWLMDHDLAPADADLREFCVARLCALREQIRALFGSRVSALPASPAALDAVNEALARVPTARLLQWDKQNGLHRAAPHPTTEIVDHALATLAADAADLLTGPDAERLTACNSAPCRRYFLRQGRRQWCSLRCGDRVRAARAYARRTARSSDRP